MRLGGNIMKMIVGLGNPGRKYQNTKHNIGFIMINGVFGSQDWQEKFEAKYKIINFAEEKIIVIQPLTYMNSSGQAVQRFVQYYDIKPSDIMVIRDDIDLPLANIRIKKDSSDGGHNGIKSIAECLGTYSFCQLKIGIANGNIKDAKKYVLAKLNKTELEIVYNKIQLVKSALEGFINKNIEWVMNNFNHN